MKILNFVPLPDDEPMAVSLQIKACHHLSKALFVSLSRENEDLLAQIIEHLQVLANSVIGLPMVLRCLMTGKFAFQIRGHSITTWGEFYQRSYCSDAGR